MLTGPATGNRTKLIFIVVPRIVRTGKLRMIDRRFVPLAKFLLFPGMGGKYCDLHVCMYVCLSVCLFVCPLSCLKNTSKFHPILCTCSCGRGSVLLWRQGDVCFVLPVYWWRHVFSHESEWARIRNDEYVSSCSPGDGTSRKWDRVVWSSSLGWRHWRQSLPSPTASCLSFKSFGALSFRRRRPESTT